MHETPTLSFRLVFLFRFLASVLRTLPYRAPPRDVVVCRAPRARGAAPRAAGAPSGGGDQRGSSG